MNFHLSQPCATPRVRITAPVCRRKCVFAPTVSPVKDARGVRMGLAINVCCAFAFFWLKCMCMETRKTKFDSIRYINQFLKDFIKIDGFKSTITKMTYL